MGIAPEPLSIRFRGLLPSLPPGTDPHAFLAERYRTLGDRFLDGLDGEFAVALTDRERGLRLVASDPYGNRRTTIRERDGRLAVDDEIPELAAGPVAAAAIAPVRLAEFFGFAELSSGATFVPGTRDLLPGELRIAGPGGLSSRWLPGPDPGRRLAHRRWEEAVEEFAALLGDAVARSLAGVERCAVWLSGGLDSSPLAAHAARLGRQVDGLCWQFSHPAGDELALATAVGRHAGFAVHPVPADDAGPFADLAAWPLHPATPEQTPYRELHERSYRLAAALGHRVVVSGFSGDQLYSGARRWFWTLLAAAGPGRAIDRLREVARAWGWRRAVRSHLLGPLLPRRRALTRYLAPYLTPRARELLEAAPYWPPDVARARRPHQAERVLSLLDSHGGEVERWFAARHGLELRLPLRDPRLVDFALAAADHLFAQGEVSRPVLRAATRGLLPESVRRRRDKAHFGVAVTRNLAAGRLPWAGELLRRDGALWRGFVAEAAVERWLAGELPEEIDELGFLQCLNGELWRAARAGEPLPATGAGTTPGQAAGT
ncbi:MAG TPA: asparagine synthetase B family protein [Thermoanaerobaculia bacterium]|jgi:asparagine synthase (glutamine-hydrolysing)|nr:asparagine synthetase B family protein [Acidobacteriota bacterium]OQC41697.1 MAG: Asparagine synthetase (glutamine-hydrolyzing) 3 [Acidobacteria bacterium ADurb.Bin051]HNU82853.1 asparagine synthetase B family protein [Thermoanaerobaculia bacterium]HPA96038.1 asparagine synthetase B family protein [Thermoanaerobaculia bacterium]HQN39228.1 asparagine synthetase B family protein [Thermoanaerobaculia bacterium]